ncbi:Pleiotropic regulator 1 [Papilio machaon]|uniref:Pleiotropic regulator 1 n=1 Tax=Papilio machaon TaxID=76193 RepID=A0A194RET3_PAPMA|nr:Pleiotropic regulator 1 [Papilio machaon]
MADDVIKHSVHTLVFRSLKRSHDMFLSNQSLLPPIDEKAEKILKNVKARDSYSQVMSAVEQAQAVKQQQMLSRPETPHDTEMAESAALGSDGAMLPYNPGSMSAPAAPGSQGLLGTGAAAVVPRRPPTVPKPKWHAPWKLFRVISGHLGWVRCVAVEPGNEWFATGAADRVIKIWDLATGKLKVSLTGHVIRHYHGHLSAVYALGLHPTIDVLVSAGRDATARVWDVRTKANVHTLTGHTDTVAALACQSAEPQIITGSHDSTIRLWDLAAGKSMCTLTNHKKSVRSVVIHPTQYTFASASPDNIKQWKCPEGKFIQNLSGHNAIVNCMAVNSEGVLVSGGDNGTMFLWDWRTGYNFQRLQAPVQPGSMDSEAGIFSMTFDQSGSRLITTEADKTIKIYKEDDTASEETHPVNWRPEILKRRKF